MTDDNKCKNPPKDLVNDADGDDDDNDDKEKKILHCPNCLH